MNDITWRYACGEWGLFADAGFLDRGFATEAGAENHGAEYFDHEAGLRVECMCACGRDVPDGACDTCDDEAYLERPEPDYEAWVEDQEDRRHDGR